MKCECGGVLEINNEYTKSFSELLDERRLDTKRYLNFIPIKKKYFPDLTPPVTPCISKRIDNVDVFFKLEYLMPSGSFKDRGSYVTVAKLKEEGIREVSLDSSGNAAISLALYGKSEGIKTHIFIPKHISESKKKILKSIGHEVYEVSGSRMKVHEKAQGFERAQYVSHWFNPFFTEGTKISAYEIGERVDQVVVPTGSGTLFYGMYKGFKELNDFGVIEEVPTMISVEAKGYESLKERSDSRSELAEGIEIVDPPRKSLMEEALDFTGGFSVSVDDEEIIQAKSELASMGFLVEPTSATAYAAFNGLLKEDKIEKNEKVLIPLTGSGLKYF
ncbi:MAG: pyridoxal-phosphate dependent enzyme [Thermoplasmatota archaeon]